jgi:nitrate reductase delta subunit
MLTLKVISALLCYPQADMQAALDNMVTAVTQEALLPPADEAAVLGLIRELAESDLLELQERYVALFDRGQAMVDLMNVYRTHGFAISAHELPDYLPLLLEYLSQRPCEEAREVLTDAMPIISLLGARLQKAGSPYHVLFKALESFAGAPAELVVIRAKVAAEGPDQTLVKLDEIWEEEAVRFLGAPAVCQAGSCPTAAPVQWRSRPATPATTHPAGADLPPAAHGGR